MKKIDMLNEFLSTYQEVHAVILGLYCGLTEWKGLDAETLKNPDVVAEPHYAKLGYVVGTILRWTIIITLVSCGVNIV